MEKTSRRRFTAGALSVATASLFAMPAGAQGEEDNSKRLIVGVACSPRKGKTTATAVQESLNAAEAYSERIETRLLDLGGMSIHGWPLEPADDDFASLLPVLKSDHLAGLIVGSPVYYRAITALCKAFLERLAVLRVPELRLAGKVVGALSVGAYRNGGQELAISEIQNIMLCHEATIVGGKAGAFQGATLHNAYNDDIARDELGMESARKLGARVAEAILSA